MRIAIFGGTGLAGTPLLAQTLAAGHTVTLLARTPAAVPAHDALTVVHGDALDPDDVTKTVAGCDAVLSTLGGYGDSNATLVGTRHIVRAMRECGVSRLVLLQGFHLHLPGDPGGLGRSLVGGFLHLADRELPGNTQAMADELLGVTDLEWTLVRVPRLVSGPPTGRGRLGIFRLAPWNKALTGDVAAAMLALVSDGSRVREAPMLQSR